MHGTAQSLLGGRTGRPSDPAWRPAGETSRLKSSWGSRLEEPRGRGQEAQINTSSAQQEGGRYRKEQCFQESLLVQIGDRQGWTCSGQLEKEAKDLPLPS